MLYSRCENIISRRNDLALKTIIKRLKLNLFLKRKKLDVYSEVYGHESGNVEEQEPQKIEGLITEDEDGFAAFDEFFSGSMSGGILYTPEVVNPGDIIEVESEDSRKRTYKVVKASGIGFLSEVFKVYEITSIGD